LLILYIKNDIIEESKNQTIFYKYYPTNIFNNLILMNSN